MTDSIAEHVAGRTGRVRQPNDRLRRARLTTPSPSRAGRPMSRQELAEAVNAHVYYTTGRVSALNAHYVGRLERGLRRFPNVDYRAGFRAVLGVGTDVELGFLEPRRQRAGRTTLSAPERDGVPLRFTIRPGCAVVVVPAEHPVLLTLVNGGGTLSWP